MQVKHFKHKYFTAGLRLELNPPFKAQLDRVVRHSYFWDSSVKWKSYRIVDNMSPTMSSASLWASRSICEWKSNDIFACKVLSKIAVEIILTLYVIALFITRSYWIKNIFCFSYNTICLFSVNASVKSIRYIYIITKFICNKVEKVVKIKFAFVQNSNKQLFDTCNYSKLVMSIGTVYALFLNFLILEASKWIDFYETIYTFTP